MKKRLFAVILGSMLSLGLSACGNASQSTPSDNTNTTAQQDRYHIALCMSHQSNSFTINVASGAKEKAKAFGVNLEVFDGKQSPTTQTEQIEQAVRAHYDGILLEPVSDEVLPAVKMAQNAGIPVITVVQQLTQQDQYAKAYCGGNDAKAGELQMSKVCEALHGSGNIAILYGPMGSDGQLRRKQGYDVVLAKYPKIKVVYSSPANWVTEEALSLTENWLQSGTKIDAVVSQNDGMAMGALQAVEDAGMQDQVKVYGIDAVDDAIAAIAAKRLSGTISQDAAGQGSLGVQTMVNLLQGNKVSTAYTSCIWIDSANVMDFQPQDTAPAQVQ